MLGSVALQVDERLEEVSLGSRNFRAWSGMRCLEGRAGAHTATDISSLCDERRRYSLNPLASFMHSDDSNTQPGRHTSLYYPV